MEKFDAIVSLGGGMNKNGDPFLGTRFRVRKALKLYKKGVAENIIFSGGKTKPTCSEAKAMKRYALEKNENLNIILEEKSKETIGNAYFTKNSILGPKGWKKIVVITSGFHIRRARYVFNKVLGDVYKIKFFKALTSPRQFLIYKLFGIEDKATKITKVFLNGIEAGDDEKVKERLYKFHPAYAPESKIRELERMSDEEIAEIFDVEIETIKKYRSMLQKWFGLKMKH